MSEVDTASLEGSPEVPAEPRSAREVGDTASLPSWPCPSPSPVLCAPPSCTLEQSDTRAEQQSKGKLVRSLAVCDESSLPLPVDGAEDNQGSIPLQITALPCFPEDSKPSRDELDADKNKETEKCNEKPKIRMLSKVRLRCRILVFTGVLCFGADHSQEYTDSTGIDLHDFLDALPLRETRCGRPMRLGTGKRSRMCWKMKKLERACETRIRRAGTRKETEDEEEKLTRERETGEMLLRTKAQLTPCTLVLPLCPPPPPSSSNPFKKFPQMSSYHRMLVHRVAAYFGMDHNVDQTGKSVIINKTSNTRM
ncbi:hypothetical protein Z043_121179 [Scleropages formosus]|uniref:R3H domain-containing protein n=1 Tax=Scleropages formosus TaxID=113540 RepID=A0A0P7WCF9_SCLFO|nr:hypothetical protein Z043_121179 [Scleropages formosus]